MINHLMDVFQGKTTFKNKRSSTWRKTRNNFLKEFPTCFNCGGTKKVEVHHIVPFNVAPDIEEDFDNLMTLCRGGKSYINCHQYIGHVGNFRKYNKTAEKDALYWLKKLHMSKQ